MLDPTLSMVLTLHSNPGVYALLIGSGISRSAGIPTGWEITLDLIAKLALIKQVEPKPDPETWFIRTFGVEPTYSNLLEHLSPASTERYTLLRTYFEPNEEEVEEGTKVPTKAHLAIAKLVKRGTVKVIISTNFDKLLEKALGVEGITPDMISSEDALQGAMPLVHSSCTIIKVNGDYTDTRIRNTVAELAEYPPGLVTILDRIFDEYGLIVCGWSAEWDIALRNCLIRTRTRRFNLFWAVKGEVTEAAKVLIDQKRADVVKIESADAFFTDLLDKLETLRAIQSQHPLSTKLVVEAAKRYMVDEKYRIKLYDLINEEVNIFQEGRSTSQFDTSKGFSTLEFQQLMQSYEELSSTLRALMNIITLHGNDSQFSSVSRVMQIMLSRSRNEGYETLVQLRAYPALLILYSCGLVALSSGNLKRLGRMLYETSAARDGKPLIGQVIIPVVFAGDSQKRIKDASRDYTPASNHIFALLQAELKDYFESTDDFEDAFDKFEYLLSLVYVHKVESGWSPVGRYAWKHKYAPRFHGGETRTPIDSWLRDGRLLKSEFFNADPGELTKANDSLQAFLAKIGWYR